MDEAEAVFVGFLDDFAWSKNRRQGREGKQNSRPLTRIGHHLKIPYLTLWNGRANRQRDAITLGVDGEGR